MADASGLVECSWDIVGDARRPSLEDVGGAQLENDDTPEGAPTPDGTFIEATWLNQVQRQVAAMARITSSVRLTVDFTAGAPGIVALMAPGETVLVGDFTLTDSGVGNTLIAWAAGKLPAVICDPVVGVNADSDTTGIAIVVSATSIRVKTRTGGALADARFTVQIN